MDLGLTTKLVIHIVQASEVCEAYEAGQVVFGIMAHSLETRFKKNMPTHQKVQKYGLQMWFDKANT